MGAGIEPASTGFAARRLASRPAHESDAGSNRTSDLAGFSGALYLLSYHVKLAFRLPPQRPRA